MAAVTGALTARHGMVGAGIASSSRALARRRGLLVAPVHVRGRRRREGAGGSGHGFGIDRDFLA